MANFRYPGPINQLERWLDVQDGTSPRQEAARPGPLAESSTWPDARNALLTEGEQKALIAENGALWDRIQTGLGREDAITDVQTWGLWKAGLPLSLACSGLPDTRATRTVDALYHVYDVRCEHEFEYEIKTELHRHFDNPIAYLGVKFPTRWQYYQWLRPFYYRAGIRNWISLLNEIVTVSFLGRDVIVHPAMGDILARAEAQLKARGQAIAVANEIKGSEVSGFVPRSQNDLKYLSNHALGQAVDIAPPTNPMIVEKAAKEIDAVLAYLKVPGRFGEGFLDAKALTQTPGAQIETAYKKMKAISEAIQAFLREWLDKWDAWDMEHGDYLRKREETRRLEKQQTVARDQAIGMEKSYVKFLEESKKLEALRLEGGREEDEIKQHGETYVQNEEAFIYVEMLVKSFGGLSEAKLYRDKGLITLPFELFAAMKAANAAMGLEYKDRKDTMHFEVPRETQKTLFK